MPSALPESPSHLRWMVARKMGVAAIVVGLAAGGASYVLETQRAEQLAMAYAKGGVRHFESPAMQMAIDARTPGQHDALSSLLDKTHFIGIRVFDSRRIVVYEAWGDVSPSLIATAQSWQRSWPNVGQARRNWVDVDGERLIQIMLPLTGKEGTLVGYVEGISRLNEETLMAQRERVRNGVLMASISVVAMAFLLYPLLLAMLQRSTELARRLLESNVSLMRSLGNAIAKRDSDTDAHNYRVTIYAVALAEAMGLPKQEISELVAGAFLHDVGKIGIPDRILLKPGKLTADEFEIMKSHVLLGIDIVADNPWLAGAARVIRHHHERFDGTGYPDKLVGDKIPRVARIFAVADVFDALTSERPYKKPMALANAITLIEVESGGRFDPEVVKIFKGIAAGLYARTVQAGSAELRQEIQLALSRYFKMEAAPEGAAS